MLTVLDEYTREALCVAVRPKMNAHDVLDALHPLLMKHGKPEFIRSDNGPEFISMHLQDWLKRSASNRCKSIQARHGRMATTNASTGPCERNAQRGMVPHHQTSSGRNQCLAQAIQPDHDLTMPLGMRPPVPETLLEKPKISGTKKWG